MNVGTGGAAPLLEREAELSELRRFLEDAIDGHGRMVLLEGAAGIGKTQLLRHARTLAQRLQMAVLNARGTEFERSFAFGVVRQLLEPIVVSSSPAEQRSLFAGAAQDARAVFTEHAVDLVPPTPLDPSFATLHGLYWLLETIGARRPVALLIDDLQWVDSQSRRFLRFLLPRLDGMKVAVVVAGRPEESDAISDLMVDPSTTRLALAALSEDAVKALVRARLASDADDSFCRTCHRSSGGNPFLLGELLTDLASRGTRGAPEDAASVEAVAPQSIQRAVRVRIERLGPAPLAIARAVAVLGDGAATGLVAPLAGVDASAATSAADALAAVGVFERGSPWRFVHPLVRSAVYAGLNRADRAMTHSRAADLLIANGADPERVALHLLETEPGADESRVTRLIDAAVRAIARGTPEAAVRYLRRGMHERASAAVRSDALRLLIRAGLRAIDGSALDGICDDPASALGARDVEISHELALWLHHSGRTPEALAVASDAIEAAERAGDIHGAMRLESERVLMCQALPLDMRERLEHLATLAAPGSAAERLILAVRSHWVTLSGDSAANAVDLATRALDGGAIFAENPDAPPPNQAIFALIAAEEFAGAERAIDVWRADARRRGSQFGMFIADSYRSRITHLRGDVARAESESRPLFDLIREAGNIVLLVPYAMYLINLLVDRDDLEGADDALRLAYLDGELADGYWGTRARFERARLRIAQGRHHEARDDLLAVGRHVTRSSASNPAWIPWASALAPLVDESEGRGLAQGEVLAARRWGSPAPLGRALRVLGTLGAGDVDTVRTAIGVLEQSPMRLERLHALCDLGAILRRRQDVVAARPPLREALMESRRLGALALARRAESELAATGEAVPPIRTTGVGALTPSELRTVRMAADGMSNRNIAQALWVTVKTVETHLSAAYRKLDVRSRRELPAVLRD